LKQEVSSWVVDWFSSRGKIRCDAREALAIDYLQSGLLSSLEIVEFVAELEDRFSVQFSAAEMQDPRFSTIGGIAQLIVASLGRDESDQAVSDRLDHTDLDTKRLDQSTKVL
jgi:acyl carrier protein